MVRQMLDPGTGFLGPRQQAPGDGDLAVEQEDQDARAGEHAA